MKVLFGIILESHLFDLVKVLEGSGLQGKEPHLGGPLGVAGHGWWSSLELHMASHFVLNTLMCDLMHGFFW